MQKQMSSYPSYNPTKPFNVQIRSIIETTHSNSGPIIVKQEGKRYIIEKDSAYFVGLNEKHAVDGIGTKGKLHFDANTPHYGARDAFAMSIDDLIEGGYTPMMVQDHIQMQEEDTTKIFKTVREIAKLCVQNKWSTPSGASYPIAITAGETAIVNTLEGMEVSVNAIGFVRKGYEIKPNVFPGTALIGIESNGPHSNGFSLLRREFLQNQKMPLNYEFPWGNTLEDELTTPTRLYLPAIKSLIRELSSDGKPANRSIQGMVHITGGGFTKLKELFPARNDVDIIVNGTHKLNPQSLFLYLNKELGVNSEKMYSTFNNGVGYVVAVQGSQVQRSLFTLRQHFPADVIGHVTPGSGKIVIASKYDAKDVIY
jgi:phosphoribosylformylglycinamidine cyclo-ligase